MTQKEVSAAPAAAAIFPSMIHRGATASFEGRQGGRDAASRYDAMCRIAVIINSSARERGTARPTGHALWHRPSALDPEKEEEEKSRKVFLHLYEHSRCRNRIGKRTTGRLLLLFEHVIQSAPAAGELYPTAAAAAGRPQRWIALNKHSKPTEKKEKKKKTESARVFDQSSRRRRRMCCPSSARMDAFLSHFQWNK